MNSSFSVTFEHFLYIQVLPVSPLIKLKNFCPRILIRACTVARGLPGWSGILLFAASRNRCLVDINFENFFSTGNQKFLSKNIALDPKLNV